MMYISKSEIGSTPVPAFTISNQSSKFDLFWGFVTSNDLLWPRVTFFEKADVKSVILIYYLPPFNDVRNLIPNDHKFEIWPQIWPQIWNLTPNLTSNLKFDPKHRFFSLEIISRFYWSFWAIGRANWSLLWFKKK